MLDILAPDQFVRTPWKNGRGVTTQLAINPGATVAEFSWRISIAQVIEDGPFSNFAGYDRHLVLLDGLGIELMHDNGTTDRLLAQLSTARFDGDGQTIGRLVDGPITDFNVITRRTECRAFVHPLEHATNFALPPCTLGFVYAVTTPIDVGHADGRHLGQIARGHLLRWNDDRSRQWHLSGGNLIVVALDLA